MRGFIAGVLIAGGLLLLPLANIAVWTQREVLSTSAFSELATEILDQQEVRDTLANHLADQLVDRVPQLAVGRFILEPALGQVLGSDQFEGIFRRAVADMHAQLERGDDRLTLNLDAILPLVRDLVANVDEGLASLIPVQTGIAAITVVTRDNVPQLWLGVDIARAASWALPVAALLCFALGIAIANNRARALVLAGLGSAAIGLLAVVVLTLGREPLSNVAGPALDVDAFNAGYEVVTGAFVVQSAVLGLVGLVAALVGIVLSARRRTKTPPATWA